MNSARKGKVVLEVELTPEAEEKLVNTLLRIYRSHTPEQITSLVSRPKPLILIRDVEESKAAKLIEVLRSQGVLLQFVPAIPEVEPAPVDSPQPSLSNDPPDKKAPGVPLVTGSETAHQGPAGGQVSGTQSPVVTLTARRKVKARREKGTRTAVSTIRRVFRRVRIAVLLVFLIISLGFAFQVYVLKKSPVHLIQVVQDKINTLGLARTHAVVKGAPASEVLHVLYTPPPSVLSVKPRDLLSAYQVLHSPRPDRRFLLAFDVLTRRWAQTAGIKPGRYRVSVSRRQVDQVVVNLEAGRKTVYRAALPVPTSFPQLMSALEKWNSALDASIKTTPASFREPLQNSQEMEGARQLVDAVDPRFALMALSALEQIYRKEGGRPELFLEAARAYATLCFLLTPDQTMHTDELAAEALAFLALAKHGDPTLGSNETEAFLAADMEYKGYALTLLEKSIASDGSRRSRILAAYLREDIVGLRQLVSNPSADASQVLAEYLNVRLLREMGLTTLAEEAAVTLLDKWPSYPAIIEIIRVGNLNLAKIFTVLYPLDILWVLESNSSLEAYNQQSLRERLETLEGKTEGGVINLSRFNELLAQWKVFPEGTECLLFVDKERIKRAFGIMYSDALYLRFNLLLNRWAVSEYAENFAASVAAGSEKEPLARYMQGMAAMDMGKKEEARTHFKAVLENPDSRKKLAGPAFWNSGYENIYKLLPLAYVHFDGRPSDRAYWGQILGTKLYDLDGALVVFKEALEQNPYMFHLYKAAAEISGSDSYLTRAIKQHPYSYLLLETAGDYFKARNDLLSQEKALDCYRKALEMAPSVRSLTGEVGMALKRLKRYQEAAGVYTRWIDIYGTGDLGEVILRAGRAEAIRKMGRPEEALRSMKGGENSYQAGAMLQAAMCYEDMGRFQDAAEWFFRAADRYKNSAPIAVDCARFLWSRGEYQAAAKMLQRNRKNAGDNSYWYVSAFNRVLGKAPPDQLLSAVKSLKDYGATSSELLAISHVLERKGRLEEAFKIASGAYHPNAMIHLENITQSYTFLRKLKGPKEASSYFWGKVSSLVPMKDMALLTLQTAGGLEAFLEEVGNPDSYRYPEYAWLLTLSAWKATGGQSVDWKKRIEFHYLKNSGEEPYYSIGRYMLGKIDRDELLALINTPKRRVEIPYFLGLMERIEGRFEEANAWYQVCLMTDLEHNLEYHSARNELYYWAHLGTTRRNRLPGKDREAVRWKMMQRESETALL